MWLTLEFLFMYKWIFLEATIKLQMKFLCSFEVGILYSIISTMDKKSCDIPPF